MNKKWQERQEMFMSRTKSKLPFTVVVRDSVIYVCLPQHCSLIKLKKTIQQKSTILDLDVHFLSLCLCFTTSKMEAKELFLIN